MIARFLRNDRGSPSVEFALMLPAMLALMFGGMEAGHFAWTQHKLVKAVREGARFASRLPVEQYCDGDTAQFDADAETNIKAVTVTGGMPVSDGEASDPPAVPGLTPAKVTVTPVCAVFASGDGSGTGIYSQLGNGGPIVTVSAAGVPYPSLFEQLGVIDGGFTLAARSSAAVIGL